jgi:type II secretory pathway component PulF
MFNKKKNNQHIFNQKSKKEFGFLKFLKTENHNIKISIKEKLNFLDSFSSLLNSGIPITNALKIIEYQTKSPKTKILINTLSININK